MCPPTGTLRDAGPGSTVRRTEGTGREHRPTAVLLRTPGADCGAATCEPARGASRGRDAAVAVAAGVRGPLAARGRTGSGSPVAAPDSAGQSTRPPARWPGSSDAGPAAGG